MMFEPQKEKYCSHCEQWLPVTAFDTARKGSTYLKSYCRPCSLLYVRQRDKITCPHCGEYIHFIAIKDNKILTKKDMLLERKRRLEEEKLRQQEEFEGEEDTFNDIKDIFK